MRLAQHNPVYKWMIVSKEKQSIPDASGGYYHIFCLQAASVNHNSIVSSYMTSQPPWRGKGTKG